MFESSKQVRGDKVAKTLKNPWIQPLDNNATVEDTSYYFQDVNFLVENTWFKVPRHHFELDSVVFRDMFRLPPVGNSPPDGSSKEHPLRLQGIAKSDFVSFLKVICPKQFHRREILTLGEWVSVLKLATMWEFNEARNLAICTIAPLKMNPAWKIDVARTCNVKQWYWPALRALGESTEPLSKVTERLGTDFSLKVAELRGMVAGYKQGFSESKKSETQPVVPRFTFAPPSGTLGTLGAGVPAQVNPVADNLSDKVPTLKFIEQLFHEELKGVPCEASNTG